MVHGIRNLTGGKSQKQDLIVKMEKQGLANALINPTVATQRLPARFHAARHRLGRCRGVMEPCGWPQRSLIPDSEGCFCQEGRSPRSHLRLPSPTQAEATGSPPGAETSKRRGAGVARIMVLMSSTMAGVLSRARQLRAKRNRSTRRADLHGTPQSTH